MTKLEGLKLAADEAADAVSDAKDIWDKAEAARNTATVAMQEAFKARSKARSTYLKELEQSE
jgi:hypothetical protein